MFKLIAVTNRALCTENFLEQIEKIAKSNVSAIILREKELEQIEYELLAKEVLSICNKYNTECIFHFFMDSKLVKKHGIIHVPLWILREKKIENYNYTKIGVSVHSKEEAIEAISLGADYLVAGHIFETDCKKNKKPRGITFLRQICQVSDVPVYAIGGISEENIKQIKDTGAAGCCIMSGFMLQNNIENFEKKLERKLLS